MDVGTVLQLIRHHSIELREEWKLPWSRRDDAAVERLACEEGGAELPLLVGLFGGASSGKSTVFNNLIGGTEASRITAKGHTTLGPVAAIFAADRDMWEALCGKRDSLPLGLSQRETGVEGRVVGSPDEVRLVWHTSDALSGVVLVDLPDFTTTAAESEGAVSTTLLPWFDRVLLVVDHERWFDARSLAEMRTLSERYGVALHVLFNRTREGRLADDDRAALASQAERVGAKGFTVLEYRRGRGLVRLPEEGFGEVLSFLRAPKSSRRAALLKSLVVPARDVLDQVDERRARARLLRSTLTAVADRTVPTASTCMVALMSPEERRQTEVLARALRLPELERMVAVGARQVKGLLQKVPGLGRLVRDDREGQVAEDHAIRRHEAAVRFFDSTADRIRSEITAAVARSDFWAELQRSAGASPPACDVEVAAHRAAFERAVQSFSAALEDWNRRVREDVAGVKPHMAAGVGVGAFGLAAALIAVPGPITALTIATAQTAVGAALSKLLFASGAGALFGKQFGGLYGVLRERLIGTEEFRRVETAAGELRAPFVSYSARLQADAAAACTSLYPDEGAAVLGALEALADEEVGG